MIITWIPLSSNLLWHSWNKSPKHTTSFLDREICSQAWIRPPISLTSMYALCYSLCPKKKSFFKQRRTSLLVWSQAINWCNTFMLLCQYIIEPCTWLTFVGSMDFSLLFCDSNMLPNNTIIKLIDFLNGGTRFFLIGTSSNISHALHSFLSVHSLELSNSEKPHF